MDVTYNFTGGTRAVGQQVNQNFADVKSAVDPLETAVADIESQLTSGIILPDGSIDFTRLQSYKTYTVSNATNATPIVITAVAHGFLTGDKVYISGVGGNTAANGTFTITKIGADTFSLDGSVGNGAFSSNGTAVIYPSADDDLVNKAYVDKSNIGTCSTASATAEKAVVLNGFSLSTGATIQVTFTNANTADVPTLNVNSTGVKSIYNEAGTAVSATNPAYFPAGSTVEFTYNGTNWIFKNRIVTSYTNGMSWSRLWTNGFKESEQSVEVATGMQTKPTLWSFMNTNYTVIYSHLSTNYTGSANYGFVTPATTSSVFINAGSNTTESVIIKSSGY